jgi:hypothetical protein
MAKPTKVVIPEVPKVEEVIPEAPKVEEVIPELPKPRLFTAVNNRLWHPHQSVYIDSTPVELKYDSWTECQHSAGLIKEV